MIAYLEGRVLYLGADHLVLVVQGIGYQVFMAGGPLSAFREEQEACLHIYQVVREDQLTLYGFLSRDERELFMRVLSVSGIGPRIALAISGSGDACQVAQQIVLEDVDSLQKIPGVGKKTAGRMVMELKDKLDDLAIAGAWVPQAPLQKEQSSQRNIAADLLETLVSLGYSEREARTVIRSLREQMEQGMSLEDLIRAALQQLTTLVG
ncbi:MAG: Holliday junction branch migration protein RuvA [Bacilli bacterium]|nr:Holliday junction branch migration protein RuvA [Bacilli bacterium]